MAAEGRGQQEDRRLRAAPRQPAEPAASRRRGPAARTAPEGRAAVRSLAPGEWALAAKEEPLARWEREAVQPAALARQEAQVRAAETEGAAGPGLRRRA